MYEHDGPRVSAITWLERGDLPPPEPGAAGRRVDFRKLSATTQDAAFVRPEFIGKLMCHLALVFHAIHRVRSRGSKTARVRFVCAGLISIGRSIETKAVENELRRPSFLRRRLPPRPATDA